MKNISIYDVDKVLLVQKSTIQARSEQVVSVNCKGNYSMIESNFEPRVLPRMHFLHAKQESYRILHECFKSHLMRLVLMFAQNTL